MVSENLPGYGRRRDHDVNLCTDLETETGTVDLGQVGEVDVKVRIMGVLE